MSEFEVPDPILNSPYEEPRLFWNLVQGEAPEKREGRRASEYYFRAPSKATEDGVEEARPETRIQLILVNRIREKVRAWCSASHPGASAVSHELLAWWAREGRQQRLFFAQIEAAETIIFLTEARSDFLQGLSIPLDEPSEEAKSAGAKAFKRFACKMATGSGKTTVMGMISAWSILNKIANPQDARFSDTVLAVCPNVTIRSRLAELDPLLGEASLYRTRDLVPPELMKELARGRVVVTNWHTFEPQKPHVGEASARVVKTGRRVRTREVWTIGPKTTAARGTKYISLEDLDRQARAGVIEIRHDERDEQGNLIGVEVFTERYLESDESVVQRVLGRAVGGKKNILVLNDEAHHAYRLRRQESSEEDAEFEADLGDDAEDVEEFYREATVWVEGLDRVHLKRSINFCVDFSATPYYLGRAGSDSNRPYPWIVSDFGLVDAIESGLVKIPQLAVRDPSGAEIPGYFNIWRWIMQKLTPAERGARRTGAKPEAVLKYANTPLAMLGASWEQERQEWAKTDETRPPVFILVCRNTKLAKVIYEWLADNKPPYGIPVSGLESLHNADGQQRTIRVDSKVVHESDSGESKSDEVRWMRFTLDTVGRTAWPKGKQGQEIYPEGFEALAKKLGDRPLHPPGRDVRCVISVGMLTEGWDCNTVTHILGLRPFTSQLLCEQVVGRALRRRSYEVDENDRMTEEVAKVLGVPFEVVPFKQSTTRPRPEKPKRHHVHPLPARAALEIRFPRVEGYQQAIRNRVGVEWNEVPRLTLDPAKIPPEVEIKASLPTNSGRPSLLGPGKLQSLNLSPYRKDRTVQQLQFELAATLTREYSRRESCEVPRHVLFPQLARIVERYLRDKVSVKHPHELVDAFLAPYYGWIVDTLVEAIRPDVAGGEAPEVPRYEPRRGDGSTADVEFWTSRDVREVRKSHINLVTADTKAWEQSAAYFIDTNDRVESFVKNAGLGFAIPYFDNGQMHDYVPDFIIKLKSPNSIHLILEVKGYDPKKDTKRGAAERWVKAVNQDGAYGRWEYAVVEDVTLIPKVIGSVG